MGDSSSMGKEIRQDKLHFTAATVSQKEERTDQSHRRSSYCLRSSPSKRNKKDTLHYSTLLLQTSQNGCQEALLYSKQKHKLLSDSQKSDTPVKIKRFTHTSDGKKVIISDITNTVSVPDQTECSFQYSEETVTTSPILSVAQILKSSMTGIK